MRTRVEIINSKGTLKEVPPFLAPAQEAISDGVWETPSRFIKSEKNKNSQSENGIRGVWIIYALFKDPKVSYAAKAFHGRVTLYAGMNGECWAGQETLAEEMNLSARQIRRMAEELIIEGWMSQKRVGRKNVYIPYQVQHEPPDLTADINVPYQGSTADKNVPYQDAARAGKSPEELGLPGDSGDRKASLKNKLEKQAASSSDVLSPKLPKQNVRDSEGRVRHRDYASRLPTPVSGNP